MMGVHPLVQDVDDFALAAAVNAGDQDDNGEMRGGQVALDIEQCGTQCRHALLISALAQALSEFRRLKH
jgi:hypothetical protein